MSIEDNDENPATHGPWHPEFRSKKYPKRTATTKKPIENTVLCSREHNTNVQFLIADVAGHQEF